MNQDFWPFFKNNCHTFSHGISGLNQSSCFPCRVSYILLQFLPTIAKLSKDYGYIPRSNSS